jgi:hypothetical protein
VTESAHPPSNRKLLLPFSTTRTSCDVVSFRLSFPGFLSEGSQVSLTRQYDRALAHGNVVVFVRDNEQEKPVSYSLPLQSEARSPDPTVRWRDQRSTECTPSTISNELRSLL